MMSRSLPVTPEANKDMSKALADIGTDELMFWPALAVREHLICAAADGKRCATRCEVMDTDFSRVPFYTLEQKKRPGSPRIASRLTFIDEGDLVGYNR
jgi:hypothetical protein